MAARTKSGKPTSRSRRSQTAARLGESRVSIVIHSSSLESLNVAAKLARHIWPSRSISPALCAKMVVFGRMGRLQQRLISEIRKKVDNNRLSLDTVSPRARGILEKHGILDGPSLSDCPAEHVKLTRMGEGDSNVSLKITLHEHQYSALELVSEFILHARSKRLPLAHLLGEFVDNGVEAFLGNLAAQMEQLVLAGVVSACDIQPEAFALLGVEGDGRTGAGAQTKEQSVEINLPGSMNSRVEKLLEMRAASSGEADRSLLLGEAVGIGITILEGVAKKSLRKKIDAGEIFRDALPDEVQEVVDANTTTSVLVPFGNKQIFKT